jgi:hypothetical protein
MMDREEVSASCYVEPKVDAEAVRFDSGPWHQFCFFFATLLASSQVD